LPGSFVPTIFQLTPSNFTSRYLRIAYLPLRGKPVVAITPALAAQYLIAATAGR